VSSTRPAKKPRRCPWFVYVLECADKTLYVGIAKDVEARLATHNAGRGARYTRARLPAKILYHERCKNQRTAMQRECEIKKWSRQKKIATLDLPCEPYCPAA
jgi:putative endonuclease